MRHLLEIDDLTAAELRAILALARREDPPQVLDRQGAALLFEKPSARTRNSMELAVVQLGGHPVTIRPDEVGLDVRESTEDVTRTLMQYHSVICARVFEHAKLERMAAVSTVPVVNLLSDDGHPVQALADLLTIEAEFGRLDDLTVAYVGDANNVARSLGLACGLLGLTFRVSHPAGYGFSEQDLDRLRSSGCPVDLVEQPAKAVQGAHVIYTDTWTSMGQEAEAVVRREAFARWQVTTDLLDAAAPDAIFMHCLPAHRGEEVTDEVLDGPRSRVWAQAENRMHSARGLLAWLLTDGLA